MVSYMTKATLLVLSALAVFVENVQSRNTVQCGVPQINKSKLILHGYQTSPGEWPWHAAVYHKKRRISQYACGGTLISEQYVLTAAHCVMAENGYQMSSRNVFVRLGVYNLDELSPISLQQHSIQSISIHDKYSSEDVQNDIAILEIATVAVFNNYVQPACLGLTQDLAGHVGTVIGWGTTEYEEVSPVLRSSRMPVIDFYTCLESDRAVFGETLSRGILCAGYTNGTTVCNGDSGSGLFFQRNNAWYLVGIVSYSGIRSHENQVCSTNGYGAFTNVRTYLPWITSVTGLQFQDSSDVCQVRNAVPRGHYDNLLPSDCGTPTPNETSPYNHHALLGEYPWMAVLHNDTARDPKHYYTAHYEGTLISNRYVLTAAQSVKPEYHISRVILGEYDNYSDPDCEYYVISGCIPPVQEYEIECILRHQSYSKHTLVNDIALVRLSKEVTFTAQIRPICLPVTESLRQLSVTRYLMSSWTVQNAALQEIRVDRIDKNECINFVNERNGQLAEGHNCARITDKNLMYCYICTGSPLGAIAAYNGMRFVQFGITSFQPTCKSTKPFMYTNVADYIDWIIANMRP